MGLVMCILTLTHKINNMTTKDKKDFKELKDLIKEMGIDLHGLLSFYEYLNLNTLDFIKFDIDMVDNGEPYLQAVFYDLNIKKCIVIDSQFPDRFNTVAQLYDYIKEVNKSCLKLQEVMDKAFLTM